MQGICDKMPTAGVVGAGGRFAPLPRKTGAQGRTNGRAATGMSLPVELPHYPAAIMIGVRGRRSLAPRCLPRISGGQGGAGCLTLALGVGPESLTATLLATYTRALVFSTA